LIRSHCWSLSSCRCAILRIQHARVKSTSLLIALGDNYSPEQSVSAFPERLKTEPSTSNPKFVPGFFQPIPIPIPRPDAEARFRSPVPMPIPDSASDLRRFRVRWPRSVYQSVQHGELAIDELSDFM
jgi:hypothetical protein